MKINALKPCRFITPTNYKKTSNNREISFEISLIIIYLTILICNAMKLTVLLLCAIPCIAKCQDYKSSVPNSVSYYHKQIKLLATSPVDDVARVQQLKELHSKIVVLVKSRNNYKATTVFTDISHSNYSAFNSALKQSGFPSLSAIAPRGGIGISGKHNHTMFNVYFFNLWVAK